MTYSTLLPAAVQRTRIAYCQKHASAWFSPLVHTDRHQSQRFRTSGPVNYEWITMHASDGSINRYYDPSTGQFLSVDPLVNQTNAPYFYAGDDPVNSSDPTGLQPSALPVTYATVVAADCAGVTLLAASNPSSASTLAGGVYASTGITCPVANGSPASIVSGAKSLYNSTLVQVANSARSTWNQVNGEIRCGASCIWQDLQANWGEAEYYLNELWTGLVDLLTYAGEAGAATPPCLPELTK